MIDPTELEAAIQKIKDVPSGEIFKAIGGVLHAHQAIHKTTGDILMAYGRRLKAIEGAEAAAANGQFRRRAIPVYDSEGKRSDTHFDWQPTTGGGKIRKFFSACGRALRFIKNCLRKK